MNPTACRIAPPRRAAKSFAISCSALNSRSVRKATPSDEQQQGQTKEQRDQTHRKPEGRVVLIAAGRKPAYQEVCPEPAEPSEEAGYRYEMRTTNPLRSPSPQTARRDRATPRGRAGRSYRARRRRSASVGRR